MHKSDFETQSLTLLSLSDQVREYSVKLTSSPPRLSGVSLAQSGLNIDMNDVRQSVELSYGGTLPSVAYGSARKFVLCFNA